jgi:hypothetical protein
MCLQYIYNLCFKEDNYEYVIELQEQNCFEKCIHIIKINEPDLIINYNSENGVITFSKTWVQWSNNVNIHLKNFIKQYNQLEVSNDLIQLVYFCIIPMKYHKTFLALLEAEYEKTK